jgi:inosine/xanthosine triphosphate pyrophosphatase family protein
LLSKEYDEIQADSSLEIARYQALKAAKENNVSVIREDHSLFFDKLGIPGPYTNYIERKISAELLIDLLGDNNKGYFEIATVYAEPNGKTKEFVFRIPIEVSKYPR